MNRCEIKDVYYGINGEHSVRGLSVSLSVFFRRDIGVHQSKLNISQHEFFKNIIYLSVFQLKIAASAT